MKKNFGLILAISLGLSALLLTIAFQTGWVKARPPQQQERASVGALISYQGNIYDGDSPFNGMGYFKFAVVNETGSVTYWSNDGTSVAGSQPTAAVPLMVTNGLFSVNLGDTSGMYSGMTQNISYTTFSDYKTLLRVWFSPDGFDPYAQLPDQKVAAVPYALQAVESVYAWEADNATQLNGLSGSAYQLRVTGTCPAGYSVSAVNSDGSLVCELVEVKPVFSITTIEGTSASRGMHNSITIGVDGFGLISYHDNTNNSLMVAHCENIACTSFSTSTIDILSGHNYGYGSSIAIGGDGLGIISYYDRTLHTLKVAHCNDITCSSALISTIATDGSIEGYGTSIAINEVGYAIISYYDSTNDDLRLARCLNQACTSNTTYLIDSTNNVGIFPSMVISQNYAIIAHMDWTNYDLRVSYFSLNDLSTKGTTVIDSVGLVGYYPAVGLGADGLPIIAYFDLSNNKLKAAHCTNSICTSFTTDDVLGEYGTGTSITIGSDNLPIISFVDSLNGGLRVVKCTNIGCSSVPTYTSIINGLNSSSAFTSTTIGTDGYPLITFYRLSNQDLLVAHCSSTTCQPFYRGR